jgi:lipopolysaccharide export system protein LptC
LSAVLRVPPSRKGRALARGAWDQVSIYLPIILMGLMALGTYWLARNTPVFSLPEAARPARHDPDYYMRGFSLKTFDASGRLKSEVLGSEARHRGSDPSTRGASSPSQRLTGP